MHRWMTEHPKLGPPIRDWEQGRVIRLKAKLLASMTIVTVVGLTIVLGSLPLLLQAILAVVAAGVIVLICSYPSRLP